MRKTGVVLFGLAFGVLLARPAPAAAEDWICTNPLGTCAAVQTVFSPWGSGSSSLLLTVKNMPGSTSGLSSFSISLPGLTSGITMLPGTNFPWSASAGEGVLNLNSSWPLPAGGTWYINLTFYGGGFGPGTATQLTSLNGEIIAASTPGSGGGAPATHTPEPATVLLLGTGLAGIALMHRRRRKRMMEDES